MLCFQCWFCPILGIISFRAHFDLFTLCFWFWCAYTITSAWTRKKNIFEAITESATHSTKMWKCCFKKHTLFILLPYLNAHITNLIDIDRCISRFLLSALMSCFSASSHWEWPSHVATIEFISNADEGPQRWAMDYLRYSHQFENLSGPDLCFCTMWLY